MRISRLRLPLIIALLAVVGLLCGVPPTDAAECKLPDGSVLRLEITYGKWSPLKLGGPWEPIKEKLRRFQLELKYGPLPGLGSGPSTWSSDFAWHTNANALHIWVTRRYPTSGPTMSQRVNVEAMQFVDDDGCIFPATQVGGGFQELVAIVQPVLLDYSPDCEQHSGHPKIFDSDEIPTSTTVSRRQQCCLL